MTGFWRQGGGQVTTALVALSRGGLRTMYVGNVGDDEHGRLSLSLLREEGIDVSRARTAPGAASPLAGSLVPGGGGGPAPPGRRKGRGGDRGPFWPVPQLRGGVFLRRSVFPRRGARRWGP